MPSIAQLRERVRGWFRRQPTVVTPRQVLIAEAKLNERTRLAEIVRRLGYDVLEASTVEEALAALEKHDPQFVLLALEVNEGGGLVALEQVRELAPEVPVVMLAADWRDGRTAEAMRRGAVAYLAPPFGPDDVREVLARH